MKFIKSKEKQRFGASRPIIPLVCFARASLDLSKPPDMTQGRNPISAMLPAVIVVMLLRLYCTVNLETAIEHERKETTASRPNYSPA